jgi:hypothetical protein
MINIDQFKKESKDMITDDEIKKHLTEDQYKAFDEWMRGQTCPCGENGEHGVYPWDLERWINIQKRRASKIWKRKDFTNEEIVKILELKKIDGRDKKFCDIYNSAIDEVIELFANDFGCEPDDYHALAYKPEENRIVHIGSILPCQPIEKK